MTFDFEEFPVNERIAQILCDRLAGVQRAEGFNTDVTSVVRPGRTADTSPVDGMAVVDQDDEKPNDEYSLPGNPPIDAVDQTFDITLHVLKNEQQTAADRDINLARADVLKAIKCGPDWFRFNGQAVFARFDDPRNFRRVAGAFCGVQLRLIVTYRTPEGDPYTAV
jgi:hypothetical protein